MPHFFVRKETGRKETPRAELRSLINCTVQLERVNSLRSDSTRLVAVSPTLIIRSVKLGFKNYIATAKAISNVRARVYIKTPALNCNF